MPPDMADMETMFDLGGQALLETSEFTLMRNMLQRSVRPLRTALTMFRRARQAVFTPLWRFGAARSRD